MPMLLWPRSITEGVVICPPPHDPFVSGSDADFLEACVLFWCQYDSNPDPDYRRELYFAFRRAWGGKTRVDADGFEYIKGGLEPVRVELP